MAIINPATIKAAVTTFAPLLKSATASLSKLGPVLRSYDPAKMAQSFANNPKLASAMNQVLPRARQLMESLQKNESFRQLCTAAQDYVLKRGASGIGNPRKEEKTAFHKTLFPPGVHSLSRESYSGNTSSVSAMVGQERWHALLLGAENRRVTQTDWKPNAHGHLTCKTWEPGQQKTWNWTQNKAGDRIAMDEGKTLKDGSRERTALFYPASGGRIVQKLAHTDANGQTTFRDPEVHAGQHHAGAPDIEKQQTNETGFIVEEVEEAEQQSEVQGRKPLTQLEPAPTASQELVRRPPRADGP